MSAAQSASSISTTCCAPASPSAPRRLGSSPLIQTALHYALIVRRTIAGRSCRAAGFVGGGWRRGVLACRLMSNELVIAGSARSRWRVGGQTAGPMRPMVGDETGTRGARPETEAETKHHRRRKEPPAYFGSRAVRPIHLPTGPRLRTFDHALRPRVDLNPTGQRHADAELSWPYCVGAGAQAASDSPDCRPNSPVFAAEFYPCRIKDLLTGRSIASGGLSA